MCKRLNLPLRRDLVLVAAADEELGGVQGVRWLAANHPEVFDAEYGINEGGGFALMIDGRPVYTCQVAEKGSAEVNLVARGQPGTVPFPTAITRYSIWPGPWRMLSGVKMPHRITDSVRAFFEGAAAAQVRGEVADLLLGVLDPERCDTALSALPVDEPTRLMFDAMVRNTCAPTILEAGVKRNVIPSEAVARLSGRPLPGVDEAGFVREVRALAGEGVTLELEKTFRPGTEFDHRTRPAGRHQGVGRPVRSRWGRGPLHADGRHGCAVSSGPRYPHLRIHPHAARSGEAYFELCHGHDERVSVANVQFGVQVLFDVVCRLNGIA